MSKDVHEKIQTVRAGREGEGAKRGMREERGERERLGMR